METHLPNPTANCNSTCGHQPRNTLTATLCNTMNMHSKRVRPPTVVTFTCITTLIGRRCEQVIINNQTILAVSTTQCSILPKVVPNMETRLPHTSANCNSTGGYQPGNTQTATLSKPMNMHIKSMRPLTAMTCTDVFIMTVIEAEKRWIMRGKLGVCYVY